MPTRIHRQSGVLKAEFALRSRRKRLVTHQRAAFLLALGLATSAPSTGAAAQGIRLNDEIIADPVTGAALLGFDPVAYFIDHRAVPGARNRQITYAGKVWYFASIANRTAFEASPATYLPAFGGHDPVAIAAGFALSGSPEHFAIDGNRVFLFRNPDSRDAFLRDPSIGRMAEQHWPQVKRDMVP